MHALPVAGVPGPIASHFVPPWVSTPVTTLALVVVPARSTVNSSG
jgi:hypothetical protein